MNIKQLVKSVLVRLKLIVDENTRKNKEYLRRYNQYAFDDTKCHSYEQYEAVITRWYHTVEKGLSYDNYRPGFGRDNINKLLGLMDEYKNKYDTTADFYETALDCLNKYIEKNKKWGLIDEALESRISTLHGSPNDKGGVIEFVPDSKDELHKLNFEEFVKNRHSMRHFSGKRVDVDEIRQALKIAQYTPSACNRQGWKARIISNRDTIKNVLTYQNGNRGFGEEIDALLLITTDLQYFNKNRELYQAFIDGGMYATNVINALHYVGLATIPLSASLMNDQESNVRKILDIKDSEIFIIYIGVGNYPEKCVTTRSERRAPVIIEYQ